MKSLEELRVECESTDKALFCLLKGRALNINIKFNENAFELLSKCVKLNPQLTEAWNQLGECYWKKSDNYSALNCFESALKHEINKISLRNASMVLRQLGNSDEEKKSNLIKSLDKAKEAVKCDIEDGISWYILGNAYLTLFFSSTNREQTVLKACKAAYVKAYNDKKAYCQTDFLFNYATLLQYEENFLKALECLKRAAHLDPNWSEPFERKKTLLKYLNDCCDMIDKKASLKLRRLEIFIKSLAADSKLTIYQNRKFVNINDLSPGINSGVNLLCKVISCINNGLAIAYTFCVMDCEKQCIALLIYNLSLDRGPKLGDTVFIQNPLIKINDFCFEDKNYKFRSISVDNPLSLIINNKRLTEDNIVLPKIDNKLRND